MPTKIEQGDLLMVLHGRNSESPVPVLAASTPGDCFHTMLEAFRLAVTYMTPVIVLSDSYLANSSEPWLIPDVGALPRQPVQHWSDVEDFQPYRRDSETLARPWAIPGTPGLEHRIGGLSKEDVTGNVSYDPANNQRMIELRAQKVAGIANAIPPLEVFAAVEEARKDGLDVSSVHLRHLNPFPSNLGTVLGQFRHVLVAELNSGQLHSLLRSRYLVPAELVSKLEGQPFKVQELRARIEAALSRPKE
jgi:2-oxoglutarate ferredoxin oxidoreductase subunit alpha